MSAFYTYLIASLPMLHPGMKPPFSSEEFFRLCRQFMPEEDFAILTNLPQPEEYGSCQPKTQVIRDWIDFDTALRNELAKIRAGRRHIEPQRYLRAASRVDLSLSHLVQGAQRNPQLLEAERVLDEARWKELENLSFGHYFDLEFLVIYAYKLSILQRWEGIRLADKQGVLEEITKG